MKRPTFVGFFVFGLIINFKMINYRRKSNLTIDFFIDIPPFIEMYKQRNDIERDVSIKDILDDWNEELNNEFSEFKFIDIEQVGADEDNGKFIVALSTNVEPTQEKEVLEWFNIDMVWGSIKLFTPFSEWESAGADWKALAEDYHGYTELDAYEFLETISEAHDTGRENLFPVLFKEAEKVCETSEDYRCLADYSDEMYLQDLAINLYKKAQENSENLEDLTKLKKTLEHKKYPEIEQWVSELKQKIENS